MKFQDLPGPETHDERVMSLRGLSPNALATMVLDCATGEKSAWLNTMLDCGLFEIANIANEYGHAPTALAFLHRSSVTKMAKVDPEYGVLERPSFNLRLNAEPETSAFFGRFVDHLIRQKDAFIAAEDSNSGNDPGEIEHRVNELFAKTIVAASALGLPNTLKRLVDAAPEAAGTFLHKDILGGSTINFMEGKETLFAPYVFAMQFSDKQGMEILRQAAPNMGAVALVRERTASGGDVPKEIDILSAVGTVISPLCVPSAFGQALRDRLQASDPPQGDVLDAHIERFLSGTNGERRIGPCLLACEKEGLFNLSPTHTARLACIHGHAEVIPNLVGIQWKPEPGGIETQPAWLAMDAVERSAMQSSAGSVVPKGALEKTAAAIAAYWNRAIADGHPGLVNQVEVIRDEIGPDSAVQPVERLIDLGFNAPLLAMLNAGLSPTQPVRADLPSALDMAVQATGRARRPDAGDTENMLRSFSARGKAHSLIDSMDLTPIVAKP